MSATPRFYVPHQGQRATTTSGRPRASSSVSWTVPTSTAGAPRSADRVAEGRRDLEKQGYAQYLDDEELDEGLLAEVAHLTAMLRDIGVGEIVERSGPGIRVRRVRAA